MKIQLDDRHTLLSDKYCFWIEETIIPKDSKQKPYTRRVSGYRPTFSGVVCSYIETKIKTSETALISELAKEVEALKAEVLNWHETVSGKHDD